MEDKVFDKEFFSKLENMSIKLASLADGGGSGVRRSRAKGTSVEFSDFREYNVGDDIRRVDWNAYGRFEKLFVKLFVEEKEAMINIFIDCSNSMVVGDEKKRKLSMQISAALSYLALNNQDKVSINLITDEGIKSDRFSTIASFQRITTFMEGCKFKGSINIKESLKRYKFKNKGLSIIVSDFLSKEDIDDVVRVLKYNNQEFLLINVLGESELNPTLNGEVTLVDSENDEKIKVTITSKVIENYKKALKNFTKNLSEVSKKYGGVFIQVSSNSSLEEVIFEKLVKEGIIWSYLILWVYGF